MNVLHLNENFEIKGGTEVYVHQLQELLPLYSVSSFFIAVSEIENGSRYNLFYNNNHRNDITEKEAFDFIKSFIIENKIDVIHIHYIVNSKLINLCLELLPVIKSMHAPEVFCPGGQKFWVKTETICTKPFGKHCLIHAFTQRCASRRPQKLINNYLNVKFEIEEASPRYKYILAMSDYIKSEAVLAGIDPNKIVVNPYFTPLIDETEIYKTTANDKIKHIVFIGRFHISKGPHLLIKAIKNILIDYEDVVLDIIGDGNYKDALIKIIRNEKIPSEKIVFHGWLNHKQIIEKLINSYLVVFPSIYPEAFGIVGIEAMMCAKPIVAFNVGGVSTWLEDGVNGYLVENKNVDSLGEKIKFLLTNEDVHLVFSKQSRESVLKKFIPDIHLKKLISLYKISIQ